MIGKTKHKVTFKALAIFLLGLFFFSPTLAQESKKIKIKKAKKQRYEKIDNNDVFWLTGDVEYEHEGAEMKCDSSIYFKSENRFEAYGNVRINQGDSITMTGERVTYDGTSKLLHISENVFMTDGTMRLGCNEIIYDRANNIAYYNSGGRLVQEDNVLESKYGYYNAGTKRFTFKDSVVLKSLKYTINADTLQYGAQNKVAYFLGPTTIETDSTYIYCEKGRYDTQNNIAQLTQNALIKKASQTIMGDSIYYEAEAGKGFIEGKAYISDTTNKYVLTGGRAIYTEQPEWALITEKPVYALQIEDDTLSIAGDTINIITDRLRQRKVRVYRNTKFFKSDFQGKSDSLTYSESDSTFHLYNAPVVWNEKNQLTADFIYMTTKKGRLDSLFMLGNAFLISMEDTNKYNQIKGRNMYGTFEEDELRSIYVAGNGQTVYYAYDEEEEEIGVNRADCSNLVIKLLESKVDRVIFLVKPKATLYPSGQIPKGELFLKGFYPRFDEQIYSRAQLKE